SIDEEKCIVHVKHKWINQSPFRSMYFAVHAMPAELSTGDLVMNEIAVSKQKISMLVLNYKMKFSKKATGKFTFTCNDGEMIKSEVQKAINSNEAVPFWATSVGTNEIGEVVSTMQFEWTLKVKQ